MNLSDPSMAITSSLDGPVLVVLASVGKPLTVSEVASKSARGSEIGIRKSLGRLLAQGVVVCTELGNTRVYSLNRDHLAAAVVVEMAEMRSELWRRIAREVERWTVRPLYASVFGSAARHEGDTDSDIDLLVVRPSTISEVNEAQKSKSIWSALGMWAEVISTRVMSESQIKKWESNVDNLHDLVRRWTGNPLQVVSITAIEWSENRRARSEIYLNITQDEVRLYDELAPVKYKYPKGRIGQ
ncbi:MAG TPA: nucleotidyltransferase domain-containing protein [Acidimicrobiales bacterium]|nr:nucleotidyltransferase domain-containing protein [Acidimicrobiales bacterium]